MRTPELDVVFAGSAQLAESPLYDATADALLWVDIMVGSAHRMQLSTREHESIELGQPIGALFLRRRGGFAYGLRDGLAVSDTFAGPRTFVTATQRDEPDKRMNDGKADAEGRLWVGTMGIDDVGHRGTLFRIDPDYRETPMVTGLSIPNGLCWSLDQKQMYFVDSELGGVEVFDYEAATGTIGNRRTLFTLPRGMGVGDGMTIDDSGCLWIAHFDGSAVNRYTLTGAIDRTIALPVSKVTSCAFGGPSYDQLFITTASVGLSEEARAREPLAGAVFVTTPGARGFAANPFGG